MIYEPWRHGSNLESLSSVVKYDPSLNGINKAGSVFEFRTAPKKLENPSLSLSGTRLD